MFLGNKTKAKQRPHQISENIQREIHLKRKLKIFGKSYAKSSAQTFLMTSKCDNDLHQGCEKPRILIREKPFHIFVEAKFVYFNEKNKINNKTTMNILSG